MKKITSFILAAVLVITTLFAMPLSSFAEDEVKLGENILAVFDDTIYHDYDENTEYDIDNSNSQFYFKPTETDYYTIDFDNSDFYLAFNPDVTVVNEKYYYMEKGTDYLVSFDYAPTAEDEQRIGDFDNMVAEGKERGDTGTVSINFHAECHAVINKAPESHSDTYTFEVDGDEVHITAYKKPITQSEEIINVPSTILGLPVTQISGTEAFRWAYKAKEINIPSSVNKIAFAAFNSMKEAEINIANPNCVFEVSKTIASIEVKNGEASQLSFDKLFDLYIAANGEGMSELEKRALKIAMKALYDVDSDGNVILWTINPAATIKSAHSSTTHDYATTYGNKFIGTDAHTITTTTKASTCTVNGKKTETCSDCDYVKETALKLAAHTPVTDKAVAPTFAKAGKTEGSHCKVCGKILKEQKTVAKLVPTATSIKSIKAKKKGFTVTWAKKTKNNTGYELQYSLKSNFSKKTTKKIKTTKTTTFTAKKLKAKKTYYVRIRAYKVYKGKTYYSKWSAKKSVKTKK